MQFLHPVWLLALWPLPFFGAAAVFARRHRALQIARLGPRAAEAAARGEWRFKVQLALSLAGFVFAFAALARPWWGEREEEVFVSSRNVLVLLDVSRSMLARDIRPSRLGRAKADLTDLARDLDGDRACLMAFRADAQTLCPFTADTGFFLEALDGAGPDSAARGETDLGGAISAALAAFRGREADHNAILLISDGEDLAGSALEAARRCGEARIPVFCVGTGGAAGASIPVGDAGETLHHDGEEVVSRLEAGTLKAIAEASGGVYLPLASTSSGARTLGSIYKSHVRDLVESDARAESERRRIERYGAFLLPAILLWIGAAALSPGLPLRRRASVASAALAFVFLAATSSAQAANAESARDIALEAQRLFRNGNTAEAAARYSEALSNDAKASPSLEADIRLNAAIAALKAGNVEDAAARFKAMPPGFESLSGLGEAMYKIAVAPLREEETNLVEAVRSRLGAMQGAADAFASAAHLRPGDSTTATNLATAAAAVAPLRERLREAEFDAKWGGKNPGEILTALLTAQREAYAEAVRAEADSSTTSIRRREKAAARQRDAAEAWKPLKDALVSQARESITNATALAEFEGRLTDAEDAAVGAADALDAMLPGAVPAMRRAEEVAFSLQSLLSDPLPLLDLAEQSQTNALARSADPTKIRTPVAEQRASAWLFDIFSQKIEPFLDRLEEEAAVAPQTAATDAGTDSGEQDSEAIAKELRAEIRRLCSETAGTYSLLAMALSPEMEILPENQLPNARQIAENLALLKKLLSPPQQQNGEGQQQEDNAQNEQSEQNGEPQSGENNQESSEQSGNESKNNEAGQSGEEDTPDAADETDTQDGGEDDTQYSEAPEDDEGSEEEDTAAARDEKETEPDPDDEKAAAIMQRILDQEKRRAEEKRERLRIRPPKVGERDW